MSFRDPRQPRRPTGRGSQAGGAPDREPPAEIRLDLQVRTHRAPYLELHRVVPALATQRRERVERAPLVQVDEAEPFPGIVPETDQGAEQLRAEPAVYQRGVHRMQVGDECLDVIRGRSEEHTSE